jgi:hypothetical protein
MASYSRLILQVVATTGFAVMLSAATPAAAVEDSAPIGAAAKSSQAKSSDIRTSPSVTKRHASRRAHVAVHRYNRRVSLVGTSPVCSGVWCGRQFVLMIGIGF